MTQSASAAADDAPGGSTAVPAASLNDSEPDWLTSLVEDARLTPKGRTVAHSLASNPRLGAFGSVAEFAEKCDVNAATVIRFAQRLGFKGWSDFQLNFRHRYLASLLQTDAEQNPADRQGSSVFRSAVQRDIENLHATLDSVDPGEFDKIAELIARAPKTLVIGGGTYGLLARVLAHHASYMGYDVRCEAHDGARLVVALSQLDPGDMLVAVNFWQPVRQILDAVEWAREQKIETAVVVDSRFSPLADRADHALIVPSEGIAYFQSLSAGMSLMHALLAKLHELGGERATERIRRGEKLWGKLGVLR
ncbi:MurR/RpiR family transcriptional regulator [Pseudonocardia sulfidoxydans]|uniref:MurR/RpiR family transcriptional regulator n=1 Tax=Pseudonocardia sulfidoxydans TaxID=54011 RepID=UPI001649DFD0|nr:MurR/RpiR family transcriptional regulator [Pseudonocardia sulfidoxydans]